jgi:hypothetical protein
MKRYFLIFAVFLMGFAMTAQAAYQHMGESDSPKLLQAYPQLAGTKLDSCTTCHTGGTYESKPGKFTTVGSCQWCHMTYGYDGSGDITETMNQYGLDYLNAGRDVNAFETIEPLDSDGDGYTNKQEIDALTYPGDANDNASKTPAPRVTYTLQELEAFAAHHKEFLLMNTSRSGDFYAEYEGVTLLDLINDAGMATGTTSVTVFAPDGYSYTYEMNPGGTYYYIDGTYPQAQFYYDVQADAAYGGWCDYSAPSCTGRNNGDIINVTGGLKLIFAYKRDGEYLETGYIDSQNKLQGEGPFRSVPPQMVVGPPDQLSTAANQDVIWPYDDNADHNAGFSARTVVAIRVEPLPEGTTDFDWYEGGWSYVDEQKVIVYGNIANGNVTGTVVNKGTNQPLGDVKITSDKGDYVTLTDTNGNFTINGLKLGTYTLTASRINYQPASTTITVTQGQTQMVTLALTSTWNDVMNVYNSYTGGEASWQDVMNCYFAYAAQQ